MARYPNKVGPDDLEKDLMEELNKFERRFLYDHAGGEPTRYEVRIDKLRVLGPTEDPQEFANCIDFIDLDKTKEVEIRIYRKNSRVNDQYAYTLMREAPKPREEGGLDGFGGRLNAEVERMRQQIAQEQLQRELEQINQDYKDLDKYTDSLEKELAKFQERRFYVGEVNLVDLGGILLEGWVRRNPHIVGKLLGPNTAAGLAGGSSPYEEAEEVSGEAEGGFERAPGADDPHLEILRRIQLAFTESQFEEVLVILDQLTLNPAKIRTVLQLLQVGPQSIGNL